MRVTNNTFPDSLLSHLQRIAKGMNKLHEQVATGQRISNISEDSAAANRILDMQEEKGKITQYSRNAARAQNVNNTTIAQLENLVAISDRVNEISTLADDLKGPDGLRAYAAEVDELIQHALQSANARFNGEYIFGGVASASAPFDFATDPVTEKVAGVTYEGAASGPSFHLSETGVISPFSDGATNQKLADFINRMVQLRDSLEAGSATATNPDMRKDLEASEDDLIFALSRQGSVQMRIEYDLNLNQQRFTSLEQNISSEADVDIAQTVVRLTQIQNAYQASLQSAGKVLNSSLLDYI